MKKASLVLVFLLITLSVFMGCEKTIDDSNMEGTVSENQEESTSKDETSSTDEKTSEPLSLNIVTPSGAPSLSMVKMIKENPSLGENVTATYSVLESTELLSSTVMSEEADIAIVPTNLALMLYNKGVNYKFAGTSVWGVMYIAGTEDIKGWEDIKNKEIYTIGRGLTPDILVRYLSKQNGIDPDTEMDFNYLGGASELAQYFISGKSTLAVLPEPLLSTALMKNPNAKVIMDLQDEWSLVSGGEKGYPQAGVIIKKDLIENHKEVVDKFLEEYALAVAWVNENPKEAAVYSEEVKTGLSAKVAESAIPRCNLRFVAPIDSEEELDKYYGTLFEFSKDIIGGKMPVEGFYYNK